MHIRMHQSHYEWETLQPFWLTHEVFAQDVEQLSAVESDEEVKECISSTQSSHEKSQQENG